MSNLPKLKLNSPYYNNFFGLDGPLSMWLSDYILKYGSEANNSHILFTILEDYVSQVNSNTIVNRKLHYLFRFYNNKIKPKSRKYRYYNIPKEKVVFKIGQYFLGQKVALPVQ